MKWKSTNARFAKKNIESNQEWGNCILVVKICKMVANTYMGKGKLGENEWPFSVSIVHKQWWRRLGDKEIGRRGRPMPIHQTFLNSKNQKGQAGSLIKKMNLSTITNPTSSISFAKSLLFSPLLLPTFSLSPSSPLSSLILYQ